MESSRRVSPVTLQRHMQVSEISIPSADVSFTNHVGKEAFITVLSDGNLQLEVMKQDPLNIGATLSHAIKIDSYEQSLVCQGTLVTDQDESRAKCRSRNVYAVSDQQDPNEALTLRRHVEELQQVPEQVAKGIAVLAAGPWSHCATQLDAAAPVGTAQGATGKKSASKGVAKAQGASCEKFGHGVWVDAKTPRPTHAGFVSSWATGPRIATSVRNRLPWMEPASRPFLVNLCPQLGYVSQLRSKEAHPLFAGQWMWQKCNWKEPGSEH